MIQNKLLSEAVLESIIGKHGVSPETREIMATRLAELFENNSQINGINHTVLSSPPLMETIVDRR